MCPCHPNASPDTFAHSRPGVAPLILAALMVACLLMSLSGCGSGAGKSGNDESDHARGAGGEPDSLTREPRPMIEVEQMFRDAQKDYLEYQLTAAETKLREVIRETEARLDENRNAQRVHALAQQGLADILNQQGRRWEAERSLFELLKAEQIKLQDLLLLGNRQEILSDSDFTNSALFANPDDPIMLLNAARERYRANETELALEFLDQILAIYPNSGAAHALKGIILTDDADPQRFLDWNAALPDAALEHPDVWLARGIFARNAADLQGALRCFWEAASRDPNSQMANYQLGILLLDEGRKQDAEPLLARAAMLNELNYALYPMFEEGPRPEIALKAAQTCEALGRIWEAWAWYSLMAKLDIDKEQNAAKHAELTAYLADRPRENRNDFLPPAEQLDLTGYSLPDWKALSSQLRGQLVDAGVLLRFVDVAAESGLNFEFFSSPDESTAGLRMLETTGGGVGVIDYDLDGWPDLHFTQGAKWPVDESTEIHRDVLYRNVAGDHFRDVTTLVGIDDARFSQGLAVGDVNQDGFPDIYLSNIGENRLFINNGDGTFETVDCGTFGDRKVWTTSSMICDLNGDGLPDIYNANYLGGEDIHDRLCGADVRRACAPSIFDGERDQIFLNQGDGTWRAAAAELGVDNLNGKGLGLVAARFERDQELSVFVANDAVANHFLVRSSKQKGQEETESTSDDPVRFVDMAMSQGLAFDRDARFQACMGVAFGDVNGDEQFEIFVTNYYNDSNTLYSQGTDLLFDDLTRRFGLREPSFLMLGFGTQFLDVELDGQPDLVITNGHVDDYDEDGAPFEMRPQLLRNQEGRFVEATGKVTGRFFDGVFRGRGLALVDWNRDGREDFAISHLDSKSALVENQSEQVGHFIVVHLRGSSRDRDAFGTWVTVTADGKSRTRQLAAGSGYQAGNQRVLVFGLGEAENIESVEIDWIGGEREVHQDVPLDAEVLFIEGSPSVVFVD